MEGVHVISLVRQPFTPQKLVDSQRQLVVTRQPVQANVALYSAPVRFNAVGAHTGLGINEVFFVVYSLVTVTEISKLAVCGLSLSEVNTWASKNRERPCLDLQT